MDIANFPSLTGDEFLEACHYLDSKYCRATLGPVRSAWKLKLQTSQSLDFNIYGIPTTYVEITRPLKALPTHHDIELELARFSISDNSGNLHGADAEMMDHEDADEVRWQWSWCVFKLCLLTFFRH
jgi:ubiquitin-like-conjugating enzyme ATG10